MSKKTAITPEQAAQKITLKRINHYHRVVGEDFIDQNESITNGYVFGGWLMRKYPKWSTEILSKMNTKYFGIQDLMEIYPDDGGNNTQFYRDFCTLANFTTITKGKVNQILFDNLK